jgi:rRNA maturation endonuclease Nob1
MSLQEEMLETEGLTEKQSVEFKNLITGFVKSYEIKDENITDEKWLISKLKQELPNMSDEQLNDDVHEIISSIEAFNSNIASINEASEKGISKESWLASKLQEASVGMSINEYGKTLQKMDDILAIKNNEMREALSRNSDGNIKMSRNMDGNIAEHMLAKTTELSGFLQEKDLKVEVRDVFTSNSVDVRATDLSTGKYQNYQMKFGKNAKETIKLIKSGNYSNQRLVVPKEQLDEVSKAFPNKTVTDHIEIGGAKGKSITKEHVKNLQNKAQQENSTPNMDYNHYQTKDLAMSVAKNAGLMSLQSAAITTGFNFAQHIAKGEGIDSSEMVEIALTTGIDTGVKVATAGALQVMVRKGSIPHISKLMPAGVIANIANAGVENVKTIAKVASGDLSVTKGLDSMGRTTLAMLVGNVGAKLALTAIPVIGIPMAVVSNVIVGTLGYMGGAKVGESIYTATKTVCNAAISVVKTAWNGLKSGFQKVRNFLIG